VVDAFCVALPANDLDEGQKSSVCAAKVAVPLTRDARMLAPVNFAFRVVVIVSTLLGKGAVRVHESRRYGIPHGFH